MIYVHTTRIILKAENTYIYVNNLQNFSKNKLLCIYEYVCVILNKKPPRVHKSD